MTKAKVLIVLFLNYKVPHDYLPIVPLIIVMNQANEKEMHFVGLE
jgi:hypothetical protein